MQRIIRAGGTPFEIGRSLGRLVGGSLAEIIDRYIAGGPSRFGTIDTDRLHRETMTWFDRLPERFQQEMLGVAEGSGVPIRRIAEWTYVEACTDLGCSSFMIRDTVNRVWVGRSNDLWSPKVWGYAIIRDYAERVPTLCFGMPGESFSATGINRSRLWLHYHFLPPQDPPLESGHFEFIWMTDALETCVSLGDVEDQLRAIPRRGSMLLFAVDGKTDERAVYECEPDTFRRLDDPHPWIAGTNHRRSETTPSESSRSRLQQLEHRLHEIPRQRISSPDPLIDILADPQVEQRQSGYGTVYANVACPASGEIHYTLGGFPAASQGAWTRIEWPWD